MTLVLKSKIMPDLSWLDYDLKNLSSAIEPILIVIIGGMVLVLALGVFLPMWNLASIAR